MKHFKVLFKNGTEIECAAKYITVGGIAQQMNENNPFVMIGETAVNRYEVLSVKFIGEDTEDFNENAERYTPF